MESAQYTFFLCLRSELKMKVDSAFEKALKCLNFKSHGSWRMTVFGITQHIKFAYS